jgi:Rrf2 family iron-sulfur cluster assembly transcriptional regulator
VASAAPHFVDRRLVDGQPVNLRVAGFTVLLHAWPAMQLLSSQVRYAISGIFDLAYHAQFEPVQLRVIGERQGIPARYLEQIFQRLRREGLVVGKRGPGGGYTLSRGTSEITLRDIVEAVEGPIDCCRAQSPNLAPDACTAADSGPGFLWESLAERFATVLAETSVEDLCREASLRGVKRAASEAMNYQI